MRRYKPWQLVLGYIIGLAVLIGVVALAIFASVIVHFIWFLNQNQGGMCICRGGVIWLGVPQECLGS